MDATSKDDMSDREAVSVPELLTWPQRVFLVAGLILALVMVFAVLWMVFE
jgi:hypothetical protein